MCVGMELCLLKKCFKRHFLMDVLLLFFSIKTSQSFYHVLQLLFCSSLFRNLGYIVRIDFRKRHLRHTFIVLICCFHGWCYGVKSLNHFLAVGLMCGHDSITLFRILTHDMYSRLFIFFNSRISSTHKLYDLFFIYQIFINIIETGWILKIIKW